MKKTQIKKTRTRNAIIEAFQYLMTTTSFDKIRIQDITDIAEINRHSFYNHFDDKYDLLYQILLQMFAIEYDSKSGEPVIMQMMKQIPQVLHFFEKDRRFFKSAFKHNNRQSVNDFFQNLIVDWLTNMLNNEAIKDSKDKSFLKVKARFYIAGCSQLIVYWLYNEPNKPADVLSDEINRIFKSILYS